MNLREIMQTPIGEYVPIGNKPDVLWRYDAATLKAYTEDCLEKRKIERVTGVSMMCRYYFKENGTWKHGWDLLVPYKRAKTVHRILSGAQKKSQKENEKNEQSID